MQWGGRLGSAPLLYAPRRNDHPIGEYQQRLQSEDGAHCYANTAFPSSPCAGLMLPTRLYVKDSFHDFLENLEFGKIPNRLDCESVCPGSLVCAQVTIAGSF